MLQRTGSIRQQNQQDTPQGLKKLLVKRRWAGMEQDAEELRHKLEDIAPEECIAMGPVETD
jgi:hypothetical protein